MKPDSDICKCACGYTWKRGFSGHHYCEPQYLATIASLEAERDAALNTCTLITEALGITGAVAGDTIARVQQLVSENAEIKANARAVALNAANNIAYAIFNLSDKALDDLMPGISDTTCPTDSALMAERDLREFATSLRSEWNETQIPTREILALTDHKPAFGHPSGARAKTHWICFIKEGGNR
ncbi:Uncharacterised protein [Yersinia aldovae]|uniref:hypothetical protein n=1 Tax=Yersinia aldovae TaxID=29483 RepID=UPI0005E0A9EA|nr:hypothetical protein [Yersinia aldovae]CNJ14662.1 Uncharacterised protein [Yersinia aldovae]